MTGDAEVIQMSDRTIVGSAPPRCKRRN